MEVDKRMFTTRLDRETIKILKILAATQEKSVNVLLEEAIQDLVQKYRNKELMYNSGVNKS
jgi:predicted HicB family RNase H-like nuclease